MNLLLLLLLFQATTITPERQAAMNDSATKAKTMLAKRNQDEKNFTDTETKFHNLHQTALKTEDADRAKFVASEKARLGLDQSWSWDDIKGWVKK